MTKRPIPLFLLALAAGCGGGADSTTTTAVPVTTTETTASPPETTTTTATSTATGSSGGASDACLLGDWVLDTESFAAAMKTPLAAGGGPLGDLSVEVTSGGGNLSLGSDGAASGGYVDLTITMDTGSEGVPGREMVLSGEIVGSWTLAGDTLELTAVESTFDIEAVVGGQPFDAPIQPDLIDFGSSASTVSCHDERLVIEPQVEGAAGTVWLRV